VHFDQGFRFLGVQFIRSLAFKTEADEPDLLALPAPGEKSAPVSAVIPQAEPQTLMELAFSEANVRARDFPACEDSIKSLDHRYPNLRTYYSEQSPLRWERVG